MQWLVDHGIAAGRLTAEGFGPNRPIADNKTLYGRAKIDVWNSGFWNHPEWCKPCLKPNLPAVLPRPSPPLRPLRPRVMSRRPKRWKTAKERKTRRAKRPRQKAKLDAGTDGGDDAKADKKRRKKKKDE